MFEYLQNLWIIHTSSTVFIDYGFTQFPFLYPDLQPLDTNLERDGERTTDWSLFTDLEGLGATILMV